MRNFPPFWTDERVATLKQMWDGGYTCSQIASELREGCTRNAVISKVHRLGLSGRRPSNKFTSGAYVPKRRPEPAPRLPRPPKPAKARTVREAVPIVAAPSAPYHGPLGNQAVVEIKDTQCKWPIGSIQAPEFHFCAEPVWTRKSELASMYCPYHHRLAYTPAVPAKKRLPVAPIPRNPTAEVFR